MSNDSLRGMVLTLMRSRGYQPLTRSELARHLGVPSDDRAELRKTLEALVAEGCIVEGRKARYEPRASSGRQLVGTLKFHPQGHAFFFPDPADEQNLATGLDLKALSRVRISRREVATALDGDRVLVSIRSARPGRITRRPTRGEPPPDEPTGKVDQVVSRRSNRLVGVFRQRGRFAWADCDDKAVDGRVEISGDTTARAGQLVVIDLTQWTDRNQTPRGRVIEVLGWPGDKGVDMLGVIHRFGLRTAFPEPVLTEARATPEVPDEQEISRRRDWRDKLVITIDPADAKDHDDAIWLQPHAKGWTLAVHIADVSHYVKPGTAMDREAVDRGNSTYLVDRVLPMLPTELSNGICSLKPDVDRLTKCALMEITQDGKIAKARFFDAVIHSPRETFPTNRRRRSSTANPRPQDRIRSWCRWSARAGNSRAPCANGGSPPARSTSKCRKPAWFSTTRAAPPARSRWSTRKATNSSRNACSPPTRRSHACCANARNPPSIGPTRIPIRHGCSTSPKPPAFTAIIPAI